MPELIMQSLSYYTNRLKDKPFSLVRYQDGDWRCLSGARKYTKSHSFVSQMTQAAKHTLSNPHLASNYIYSTVSWKTGNRYNSTIKWHYSDIFTISLAFGNLFPMIQQIRKMKVIVVGSEFIRPLKDKVFPYAHFIEIPYRECWTEKDRIEKEILNALKAITGDCLISFSSGTLANILIHKLYPIYGNRCFMIDFGCVWDFLCRHIIRGDWRMRSRIDGTWVDRVIEHALGEDKINGSLLNPVYLGGEEKNRIETIRSVIK